MKRNRLMLASDFRSLAGAATSGSFEDPETKLPVAVIRDCGSMIDPTVDLENLQGRSISYIFATEKVARDGHTVSVAGMDFTGFDGNPVFLWAHDADEPPIGRVSNYTRQNGVLRGDVEYADYDLSPFADMIFRMVKKRFINATSISWLPVEWKYSTDRSRSGGIDFLKEDMLEISQVPVPAQASALATARSAGIDTSPMRRWAERVLDTGDKILIPRAELELIRNAARMPVVPKRRSINAADPAITVASTPIKRRFSRDLYQVAELANILMWLDWVQEYAEWEAEYENDNSDVPARLLATLQELGSILKDMTIEEVNELLAIEGEEDTSLDIITVAQAAKTPAQRAVLALAKVARAANAHATRKFVIEAGDALPQQAQQILRGQMTAFLRAIGPSVMVLDNGMKIRELTPESQMPLIALIETRVRSGRKLSAANEESLRSACNLIQGVVDQVARDEGDVAESDEPETQAAGDDAVKRAQRVREAESVALQNPGE